MSERYSRLFTLPENLYATGSPVVIAAGTLLKDTQTGRIVAQLKLKSISNREIKAVKVRLDLADTAGNSIGNSVEYDYLDLNVMRDAEFGQKNPIVIPEAKARSYNVKVTEVVFADRILWTATEELWTPLSSPKSLSLERELLNQYRLRFGFRSTYIPKEEKNLWYCTCGALNHIDENCHYCRNSLFELQALDMAELAAEKDARLVREREAAEAKAAAEKAAAEAAKKKTARILKIVIPTVCAVVAVTLLTTKVIIPNSKYNKAVSLMEAGQYEEAIAAFEAMDGYKDSAEQIVLCQNGILEAQYNAAIALKEQGKYIEAIAAFQELGNYKDCPKQISVCEDASEEATYQAAVALMESGKFVDAKIKLKKVEQYKDSVELIVKCNQEIAKENKQKAINLMKAQKFKAALDAFTIANDLGLNCSNEITECELSVLENSESIYVTSGKPKGKVKKVSSTKQGDIKVHSITRVDLDNGCVRFTVDCTVPFSCNVSFFNPPNGSRFMYVTGTKITKGRQTLVIDVTRKDIKAVSDLSMKFFNYGDSKDECWIYVRNPY